MERTFRDGYILSYQNESINHTVEIQLIGELTRNFLTTNTFRGKLMVGDLTMLVESPFSGGILDIKNRNQSKNKIRQIEVNEIKYDDSHIETKAIIHISEDFKTLWGYSNEMRKNYEDTTLLFLAPATDRDEAIEILVKMTNRHRME